MHQHERYEILGLIGNGDFAAVYRARDRELGRDVAIKQIHGQYMNDPRRLGLPDRRGDILVREIRSIYPVLPIVIASGQGREDVRNIFKSTPSITIVGKPYTSDDLIGALRSFGVRC